jgi:hypothetical protein
MVAKKKPASVVGGSVNITRNEMTDFVNESLDTQRKYSEDLFSASEKRIEALMTKALETIRPDVKLVKLPEANERAFEQLEQRIAELCEQYKTITGFYVVSIDFYSKVPNIKVSL